MWKNIGPKSLCRTQSARVRVRDFKEVGTQTYKGISHKALN